MVGNFCSFSKSKCRVCTSQAAIQHFTSAWFQTVHMFTSIACVCVYVCVYTHDCTRDVHVHTECIATSTIINFCEENFCDQKEVKSQILCTKIWSYTVLPSYQGRNENVTFLPYHIMNTENESHLEIS